MTMQLGLEGMTSEEIGEMRREQEEDARLYYQTFERHSKWLPKHKRWIYAFMGLFGCGYEEAFHSGWIARDMWPRKHS